MKMLARTVLTVGLLSSLVGARTPPKPFASILIPDFRFRAFEDDAGGFYLVWADGETDKTFTLRAQHIGPGGQALWPLPASAAGRTTARGELTEVDTSVIFCALLSPPPGHGRTAQHASSSPGARCL